MLKNGFEVKKNSDWKIGVEKILSSEKIFVSKEAFWVRNFQFFNQFRSFFILLSFFGLLFVYFFHRNFLFSRVWFWYNPVSHVTHEIFCVVKPFRVTMAHVDRKNNINWARDIRTNFAFFNRNLNLTLNIPY